MIERVKVFIWTLIHFPRYRYEYWRTRNFRKTFGVLNSENTIRLIVSFKYSVSRFGDGELQLMHHYMQSGNVDNYRVDTFFNYNKTLAKKLIDVYQSTLPNHLLCVPYSLKDSSGWNLKTQMFWEREWLGRYRMLNDWDLKRTFGDTNFVRFYMNRSDIKDYRSYITLLQKIWENRDVLIVEGERSRLGIGNNLFDRANTVQRILCPATNAFDKYNQIVDTVKTVSNDKLILIALGPTATVLAYDLHQYGYQAIDIGHIDIEYEWYLMKAKHKVAVPNKYVNEVREGRIDSGYSDALYQSQIIGRIE